MKNIFSELIKRENELAVRDSVNYLLKSYL